MKPDQIYFSLNHIVDGLQCLVFHTVREQTQKINDFFWNENKLGQKCITHYTSNLNSELGQNSGRKRKKESVAFPDWR